MYGIGEWKLEMWAYGTKSQPVMNPACTYQVLNLGILTVASVNVAVNVASVFFYVPHY